MSNYRHKSTHVKCEIGTDGTVVLTQADSHSSDQFCTVSHGVAVEGSDGKMYDLATVMRIHSEWLDGTIG